MDEFTHREVPRLGRRLFRLGLSGSFGLDEAGCREALERLQYVFWSPRMKALTPALRDALARDRDRYVISAGPLFGYFPGAGTAVFPVKVDPDGEVTLRYRVRIRF